MAKEVKKTQKSVQADEVKKDTPITDPEVTELPVAEVIDDSSAVDLRSDEDKLATPTGSFTFGAKTMEGYRRRVNEITDKPILSIAGVDIELTKLEKENTEILGLARNGHVRRTYGNDNILAVDRDSRSHNTPYINQVLTKNETEWYTATHAGVEFVLSQGSEVIVTESLSTGRGWDYDELDTQPSKLTMLGASIECRSLTVVANNSFNNTLIRADNLYLTKAMCAASYFSAETNVSFHKVDVRSCQLYDCKYLNLFDCYMESVNIYGPGNLNLRNIKHSYNRFHFSIYCRNGIDLTIDGNMAEHTAWHSVNQAVLPNTDNPYQSAEMRIKRRVDYGTFSGRENIPFIRVGDVDMLVQGELFLAKDFFPEYYSTSQKPAGNVFTGTDNGFNLPFANTGPAWLKTERGGEMWEKAARIVFPGTKVIGKSGHEMIKTLLDQIRSRIGLYVELHNLKE